MVGIMCCVSNLDLWIIARLGGWNGYRSESPLGPIVMLRGLQKFEIQYEGFGAMKCVHWIALEQVTLERYLVGYRY